MNEFYQNNYEAWNTNVIEGRSGEIKADDLFLNIISWAVLAANSHNVQPWRFEVKSAEGEISVLVDKEALLPASDPHGRQALISVGCAIENIRLAANYYGYVFRFDFLGFNLSVIQNPVVKISLSVNNGKSNLDRFWLDAIKSRRVNRAKYDGRPIDPQILAEIRGCVNEEGVVVDFIEDIPTRFAIAEIQYIADRAVIALPKFRKELARYLLPNDTVSFTGMPGSTFGLSDSLAGQIHAELGKEGIFNPDWAVGFGIAGRDGIKSSPVLAVLSVIEDSPKFWINAGMVFQRMSLIAERNKINSAVHAAMVEVEMMNKLLRLRLGRKERPTVIFRLGYSTETRPHSPRLPVEKVVKLN